MLYTYLYAHVLFLFYLIDFGIYVRDKHEALHFGKQYCTKNVTLLLVSLHPVLTTIYCEIKIRPRLPALIAMKECYQFFSKQCTLHTLPEHVKMLYWLHVCCFVYWMEIM